MSWLTPKLNRRIQIKKVDDLNPNSDGGFDRDTYTTLLRIWAGVKPITPGYFTRGLQTEEKITHNFIVRRIAVSSLGGHFAIAFGDGFKNSSDLHPIKNDFFIFLECGSSAIGRFFKIKNITNADERNEYLILSAEEMEEVGTGY